MNFPVKRLLIKGMEHMAQKMYVPEKISENLRIIEDISYVQDDLEEHKLDIIYPQFPANKYPVIINIHGGAFCMNSKNYIYRNYGIRLSGNKFAIVNINYRLSTTHVFPAQILDVIAAIKYICKNADAYQLDTANIFLSGDSAGAYLASMIGAISCDKELQEYYNWKPTISIRAIASNCGLYDFETYMQKDVKFPMKKGILEILFGTKDFTKTDSFSYSSVLNHVNENFPPIYIMDTQIRSFEKEALRMKEKAKANGIDYQIHIYDKKYKLMHAFHVMSKYSQSTEVLNEMFAFFHKHLVM